MPNLYYGAFQEYPHGVNDLLSGQTSTAFEVTANKGISLISWYQAWGSSDNSTFKSDWMDAVRNHGSIPVVTWEPWVPGQGPNQSAYALKNITAKNFDTYIQNWATASAAWGHPYFIRWAHEMNGNWYPWGQGVNGNSAQDYVDAWQHVYNVFTKIATNATWIWCPNKEYATGQLTSLYPGSSFVDWIGIDAYNWGDITEQNGTGHSWHFFADLFNLTYSDLTTNVASGKPLMIVETASNTISNAGYTKPQWITDAFTTQLLQHFPHVNAIVWFDQNNATDNQGRTIDWEIETLPAGQMAFQTAIAAASYLPNQYQNLSGSPISPPYCARLHKEWVDWTSSLCTSIKT